MSHKNELKSQVNVPFSWEHKPGVSKVKHHRHHLHLQESIILDDIRRYSTLNKLPLPPPSKNSAIRVSNHRHDTALKASSKNHYFKKIVGYHQEDLEQDPFLVAYNKCTTSSYEDHGIRRKRFNVAQALSCKYSSSCDVASDNLVRMSQIPGSMMKEREFGGQEDVH